MELKSGCNTHHNHDLEPQFGCIWYFDKTDVGGIIAQGTLKELRKFSDVKDLITVKLADSDNEVITRITSTNPLFRFDSTSETLKVESGNISKDVSIIINHIQNSGGVIERIYTQGTNLESIFLKLTGKKLRD